MKDTSGKAARMALASIASGAGRARLGDRLPEDRRPSRALLEELGLVSRETTAEDDDEDED